MGEIELAGFRLWEGGGAQKGPMTVDAYLCGLKETTRTPTSFGGGCETQIQSLELENTALVGNRQKVQKLSCESPVYASSAG